MGQLFDAERMQVIPVTLIAAGPCKVLQLRTAEKDGYSAVQLGFEEILNESKKKKSQKGKEFHYVKEMKSNGSEPDVNVGDIITVAVFERGDVVRISGTSKGKGFQGGVKRWGFSGRNATHGVKHEQRTIGSTGGRFPQRVIKGRKMPGHAGADRVTIARSMIVQVDPERNIIAVRGAVPGGPGQVLEIRV